MTIIINPVPLPPFGGQTYNQITPFTYRDGLTYIEVLESLRAYIRDILVPLVNEGFDNAEDYVNSAVGKLTQFVTTAIAENKTWTEEQVTTLTSYVNDTVQQIIGDSIEVQDPVLAGILDDADSLSRAKTDALYADKATQTTVNDGRLSPDSVHETITDTVGMLYVDDFGAAEDWGVAVSTAIDIAQTTGATVTDRGLTYPAVTPAIITNKAVKYKGSGKIIRSVGAPNSPVLSVIHEHETPQSVTELVNMNYTWPTLETTAATRIRIANTANWSAGDYAVIVSDDPIPGANTARAQLEGERVEIVAVDGDYLWTARPLRVNLVTNIRVAKMRNLAVEIEDIHVEDAPGSPTNRSASAIHIRGAIRPRITSPKTRNLKASGLDIYGSFGPTVIYSDSEHLTTSPGNNSVGYGVRFNSCNDGVVIGIRGSFLRHAFTTGAAESTPANSGSLWRYGSNIGHVISGETFDTGHSGFDLHEEAAYCTFKNPFVGWVHREPSGTVHAFTMRGRKNIYDNPVSISQYGLRATALAGGGEFNVIGHTHTVPDSYSTGAAFDVNFSAGGGARRKINYSGTLIANTLSGIVNEIRNAEMHISEMRITAKMLAGENSLFSLTDSNLVIDNLIIDISGSDVASDTRIFRLADALSSVSVGYINIVANGAPWRVGDLRTYEGSCVVGNIMCDTLPTALQRGFINSGNGTARIQNISVNGIPVGEVLNTRGNGNVNVQNFDGSVQLFNLPITAERTVSEPVLNRPVGDEITYIRSELATGSFNVVIGNDVLNAESKWVKRKYLNGEWFTVAKGSIN